VRIANTGFQAARPVAAFGVAYPTTDLATGSFEPLVLLCLFAVPALHALQLNVVGTLYGNEIAMLVLFPLVLLSKGRNIARRVPFVCLCLCLAWLAAQVITDVIRGTVFTDYARGWSRIVMTFVSVCTLYLLIDRRPKRLVAYTAGVVMGGILAHMISPIFPAGIVDPWKFGLGIPVTILVALVACALSYKGLWPAAVFAAIGCAHVFLGFRAVAAVCFVTAVYVMFLAGRNLSPGRRSFQMIALMVGLSLVTAGIVYVYGALAGAGYLGNEARRKYQSQSSGRYGILLGRAEFVGSIPAIADSPLVGHGSFARSSDYASEYRYRMRSLGYQPLEWAPWEERWLIPTHSHLFGAWVEAGLAGAVFWLWVLWLDIRVVRSLHRGVSKLHPLVTFCAFMLAWDVLFSPYGGEPRFTTPFYIIVMITWIEWSNRVIVPAPGPGISRFLSYSPAPRRTSIDTVPSQPR
jgi:hypothetical protein